MAFVVTDKCIQCKHTDCVQVCPVKCFHEGENFLVINPEECIDCNLCAPECPVEAIYSEDELPEKYHKFVELNAKLSKKWPQIIDHTDPLPDAEKWANVDEKLPYLVE